MKKIIMLTLILPSISMNMKGAVPVRPNFNRDPWEKAKSDLDSANATVEKLSQQVTTLPKQIADLSAQLEALPKQLEAAKEVQKKAEEEFNKWAPKARQAR